MELITMTLLYTLEISIRKKTLRKKIKSHTCFKFSSLRTTFWTLTEENVASCSRAVRKPKNAEGKRKLIENGSPKSTFPLKKYSLKKFFWNGRMVGKQISSTRALRIYNWKVLSTTLGHCHNQYYRRVPELLAD